MGLKSVDSGPADSDRDLYLPGFPGRSTGMSDALVPYFERPTAPLLPPVDPKDFGPSGVPEGIFLPDNRRLVEDTRAYPFSSICMVDFVAADGSRRGGTGFLVSPRLVLTAGHNVFRPGEGFSMSVRVYPGLAGDRQRPPFRSSGSTRLRTVDAWSTAGNTLFDIGAIELPTDLGNDAGFLAVADFSDGTLSNATASVIGYPLQLPQHAPGTLPNDGTTAWFAAGSLRNEAYRLIYGIDTTEGQSGGPVVMFFPNRDKQKYFAVGVHNRFHNYGNAATRLTNDVFDVVAQWIGESKV